MGSKQRIIMFLNQGLTSVATQHTILRKRLSYKIKATHQTSWYLRYLPIESNLELIFLLFSCKIAQIATMGSVMSYNSCLSILFKTLQMQECQPRFCSAPLLASFKILNSLLSKAFTVFSLGIKNIY